MSIAPKILNRLAAIESLANAVAQECAEIRKSLSDNTESVSTLSTARLVKISDSTFKILEKRRKKAIGGSR